MHSIHGPFLVTDNDAWLDKENAMGVFRTHERVIHIHTNVSDDDRRRIFFHEMVHLALNDSGVSNILTKKKEEAVCDALGHYFAGACKAGKITIK